MNREFKFRAWDKQAHDWNKANGEKPFPLNEMIGWEELRDYGMDALDGEGQLVIMQFTGLKDKNGKEIYEGDVVKSSGTGIGSINWCSESAMFRVKWHDKIYYQVRSQSQAYTENGERLFGNTQLVWEVIGNLYQNPDLIENGGPQ